METVKLLSLLAYPHGQVLVLLLLALVLLLFKQRGSGITVLAVALTWFYLASTPVLARYLMKTLEAPYPPREFADIEKADVIVLLGGGVHSRAAEFTLGNLNQRGDRLLYAAALYQAGKAPQILVTGGGAKGDPTEAALSADILEVMGVPSNRLLLEEASRNTHDNARYTATMLADSPDARVLLVTSAFHMRRSTALFAAQGVTVIPAPTDHQTSAGPVALPPWIPSATALSQTSFALHEIIGYRYYRMRGWIE